MMVMINTQFIGSEKVCAYMIIHRSEMDSMGRVHFVVFLSLIHGQLAAKVSELINGGKKYTINIKEKIYIYIYKKINLILYIYFY